MKRKISTIFLSFVVVSMAFFTLSQPVSADAYGLDETANVAQFSVGNDAPTMNSLVGNIISIVLSFLGIIFLILMIYSGFLWMTARGDEGQVGKAKEMMQAALMGLILVLAAYGISYFVIEKFAATTLK